MQNHHPWITLRSADKEFFIGAMIYNILYDKYSSLRNSSLSHDWILLTYGVDIVADRIIIVNKITDTSLKIGVRFKKKSRHF